MLHIIFCMRQSVKNCACACINIKCSFALNSVLCVVVVVFFPFLCVPLVFFPLLYAIFFHARSFNLHSISLARSLSTAICYITRIKYGLSKVVHVNTESDTHTHSYIDIQHSSALSANK